MKKLSHTDHYHLNAAEGWLGLGNWREANAEVENISARNRAHLEVLSARWRIHSMARKWEDAYVIAKAIARAVPARPFGIFHLAVSLHHVNRTEEASKLPASAAKDFPKSAYIRYYLARYACHLGNLTAAVGWLRSAFLISKGLRKFALDDPAFEFLWMNIGQVKF